MSPARCNIPNREYTGVASVQESQETPSHSGRRGLLNHIQRIRYDDVRPKSSKYCAQHATRNTQGGTRSMPVLIDFPRDISRYLSLDFEQLSINGLDLFDVHRRCKQKIVWCVSNDPSDCMKRFSDTSIYISQITTAITSMTTAATIFRLTITAIATITVMSLLLSPRCVPPSKGHAVLYICMINGHLRALVSTDANVTIKRNARRCGGRSEGPVQDEQVAVLTTRVEDMQSAEHS